MRRNATVIIEDDILEKLLDTGISQPIIDRAVELERLILNDSGYEADKVEGSEWGTIILDYDVPEGFISIEVDAEEVRWFTPREFDFNNEKTGIAELYPPKLRKVFE